MRLLHFAAAFTLCLPAFAAPNPTFSKDVAPILQKHCQDCHRPSMLAPMSLLSYKEARPWAKSIRESVLVKRMPPWYADPAHGRFVNDRSLTQKEIDTIVAWVDAGAAEGDPKDMPPPKEFASGWVLGKPDLELSLLQPFKVPAEGEVDYQYIKVPTGLTEDKWVQSIEFVPGDPKVVHHVVLFVREPGSRFMADAEPGVPQPSRNSRPKKLVPDTGEGSLEGRGNEILGTYTPGGSWQVWQPGEAKRIKAGSDLVFQMHYTASGKESLDQTRVGLRFSKDTPQRQIRTLFVSNRKLLIPAGAANHRVDARVKLKDDVTVVGLFPHMHVRGKAFEYVATYPDGRTETLLKVPAYDFNWQLYYYPEKPIVLPKGTELNCIAYFDNSPNKRGNPDPSKDVTWGDQSWEEMLAGFIDIAQEVKPVQVSKAAGE